MSSSSSSSESSLCSSILSSESVSSISSQSSQSSEQLDGIDSLKPKYFVVLIPRFGEHEVLECSSVREMARQLTKWLELRQRGVYVGEVLVFYGQAVEYSDPIMNYRLALPGVGELSISNASQDKYSRLLPKKA